MQGVGDDLVSQCVSAAQVGAYVSLKLRGGREAEKRCTMRCTIARRKGAKGGQQGRMRETESKGDREKRSNS